MPSEQMTSELQRYSIMSTEHLSPAAIPEWRTRLLSCRRSVEQVWATAWVPQTQQHSHEYVQL